MSLDKLDKTMIRLLCDYVDDVMREHASALQLSKCVREVAEDLDVDPIEASVAVVNISEELALAEALNCEQRFCYGPGSAVIGCGELSPALGEIWYVWCASVHDEDDDGDLTRGNDAQAAAEKFAENYDCQEGTYDIADHGQELTVKVRREISDDWETWTVSADTVYNASKQS